MLSFFTANLKTLDNITNYSKVSLFFTNTKDKVNLQINQYRGGLEPKLGKLYISGPQKIRVIIINIQKKQTCISNFCQLPYA